MKDHYEVLEIPRNASQEDIRKAYQKLARKFHPDKNVGNEETVKAKFQEIGVAYEILSDPQKKGVYDATSASSRSKGSAAPKSRANEGVYKRFNDYMSSNIFKLCSPNERMNPEFLKKLKSFIAEGLDINSLYSNFDTSYSFFGQCSGVSLLHVAIYNNEVEFARQLVHRGANVNQDLRKDEDIFSPLLLALECMKDTEFLSELITNETIITSNYLVEAIARKKPLFMLAIIQEAKKRGVFDELMIVDNWTTVLHQAVVKNYIEGAVLLINAGVDINSLSSPGNTSFHVAIREKKYEVAQELINLGADLTIVNKKGETPLHLAVQSKEKKSVEIIVSAAMQANTLDQVVEAYLVDITKINTHMAIASRLTANPEDLLNFVKLQKLTALSDLMDNPEVLLQAMDRLNQKEIEEKKEFPVIEWSMEDLEKFCESPKGKRKLEEHSASGSTPSPVAHNKVVRKDSPERKQQL